MRGLLTSGATNRFSVGKQSSVFPSAFTLVSFSAYSSTLKVESICFSETALLATSFHAGFLLGVFDTKDRGDMFLRNRALLASCFNAGFLLGLFFDPEDRGDMFLRNVG
jgi:hypothetical protein